MKRFIKIALIVVSVVGGLYLIASQFIFIGTSDEDIAYYNFKGNFEKGLDTLSLNWSEQNIIKISEDSVEILDGAGTVTKVERDGDQTLYVYATMRRISDLNDKFSEDDDYDSDDKYSDDDEDYDDGYDDDDYDEDYDDSDEDYDEYDDDDSWYDLEVSGAGWDDQEGGIAYWDEMDDARRYQLKLYIDDKLYESDLLSEEASYDFSEYFTEGGSYYYKVRAVRGNKRGSWCVSDVLEVSDSEAEQIYRNGGWQGDEDWIDDNSGPGADPAGSAGSAVSPTEGAWL